MRWLVRLIRGMGVILLLAPTPGSAQPAVSDTLDLPTRLLFETDGCGDAAAVRRQVQDRTKRVVFLAGPAPHVVRVAVTTRAPGLRASLEIQRTSAGAPLQRELRAETCVELISAIGFVIALTLDPPAVARAQGEVLSTGSPEPPPPNGLAQEGPAPEDAAATGGAQGEPVRSPVTPSPDPASPPVNRREPDVRIPEGDAGGVDLVLGLSSESAIGPAPGWLHGGGLLAGLHWRRGALGFFREPALRVQLSVAGGASVGQTGGRASFAFAQGSVQLCPVALGLASFTLRPCPLVELGVLRAAGTATLEAQTVLRPWVSVGGGVLIDLRLNEAWFVSAFAAMGSPLIRDRFQFEPLVFHRVPAWVLRGGLGAGLRW